MLKDTRVFVLGLIATLTIANASPVFLVHPTSIAAVDGSTVEFTCTASDAEDMVYRVNNTAASSESVTAKGFNQLGTEVLDTLVVRRNLTVTVSSLYNNTEILCRAIDGSVENSNTATLTVQGPLSSVDGLSYSMINCSTINISWSPPFTLPGTHITGYNISISGTTTDYYTSNSYYMLSYTDVTDSPYNGVERQVTVSGYNGLDGSESDSIIISIPAVKVTTTIDISKDMELLLVVELAQLCVDDIVTNVSVTLLKNEMFDNSTSTLASNTISLTDVFELMEDQNYSVGISFGYFEETNVIRSFEDFDTYGVQSLDVTDTSKDTVYIVCLFNTFSTDSGCTVVLVSTTDQQQQYEGTFNKTDDDVASGSITGVATGVYNIRAFDQGSNVVAVELLSVSITGEPNITITPSNMPTAPSNSTNSSTNTPLTPGYGTDGTESTVTPDNVSSSWTVIIYYAVPVGIVIILLVLVVVILLGCYIYKKKHMSGGMKTTSTSSDTFIHNQPIDDRSPTNPYPSQNLDDIYSKPNMAAKTNAQPVVYADLSIIQKQASVKDNKPHPSPIRDNTCVVYSDLLLKGQPPPPPYEPIELKQQPSSVTVIPPTITVKENKEEEITEFFFSHPGRDDDDGIMTVPSRPPPPDGRAPSPPTEDPVDVPPPIPSRSHDNRLPDVVHQYSITQDNEYADESLHPALEEFRSEKDDHKGFMNTPTATYL